MREPSIATSPVSTSYAAPIDRAALNADCLERIISGRPLPDGLAARVVTMPCPPSTEAGLARIAGLA